MQRLWAAIHQKSFASLDGSSESAHHGGKSASAIALRQHVPACLLSLEVNEVLEYNLEMHVMSNKHFFFFCSSTSLLPCNMTGVTRVSARDCVSFVLVFHMQLINLELLFGWNGPSSGQTAAQANATDATRRWSPMTSWRHLNTIACCTCLESDTVAVDDLPVRDEK